MSNPERPTRPALSREYILHTALRIVDRDGPDKLTMRRLGAELGVDPMAVYHYLPNKAALFDGITEAIWASLDLDDVIDVMHVTPAADPAKPVLVAGDPEEAERTLALFAELASAQGGA